MFDQIVYCVFRDAGLELILVADHHYGVLIVVVRLEVLHTDRCSSVFLDLTKI